MSTEDEEILGPEWDVPVLFGLEAQGHIPIVESMLRENKTWEEIGLKIGWCGETAKKFYGYYLERYNEKD